MLEMLGVLAIMGIITYGAIAGINYGMSSYKVNQCYNEIQDIIRGIEDLYSWSKGYPSETDMTQAACKNDVFTQPCEDYNKIAKGVFGQIRIMPIEESTNFQVQINLNDASECARLTSMDWSAANIKCSNPNSGGNCACGTASAAGVAGGSDSIVLYFSPK
jgi:hypothetical protein